MCLCLRAWRALGAGDGACRVKDRVRGCFTWGICVETGRSRASEYRGFFGHPFSHASRHDRMHVEPLATQAFFFLLIHLV